MKIVVDSHMSNLLGSNESIGPNKGLSRGLYSLLTIGSEGNISATSVSAAERPFRLAVTDDEDARG
jgi:hypothetical protein